MRLPLRYLPRDRLLVTASHGGADEKELTQVPVSIVELNHFGIVQPTVETTFDYRV